MDKIKAILTSNKISSNSTSANDLFSAQRFGEQVGEKIQYTLTEALFLAEAGKMDIYAQSKKLSQKQILSKFEKLDKKFMTKYIVFKDLREKGYVVKTALKFGAEVRVYEKGKTIDNSHAKWILYPVDETEAMTWHDFSAKNRVSHSVNKNLLIAVVDEESDVSYYEVKWTRP